MPQPESFPKSNWPAEVERGFAFYFESGRSDLEQPVVQHAVEYFQRRAPEKIQLPRAEDLPIHPSPVSFQASPLVLSDETISLTADIFWDDRDQALFFSDMANSKLRKWQPMSATGIRTMLADQSLGLSSQQVVLPGNHLCKMTRCDWNGDGLQDYLIAEIGSMIISDQKLGSVAVFLADSSGAWHRHVLASDLARPVEAVPFDFDADGDWDILVAEFGYNAAGCLSLLRNNSDAKNNSISSKDYQHEVIDPRHGHLAVLLADMDNDGNTDIVTAIGQEYEAIEIRYALGNGKYRREIAMALPDPSYNTSSITICDLNSDGRLDILHTCGDIFDSFVPKAFHGVRWLENQGDRRWQAHQLGMLIGAMKAVAADFDSDGDMDLAAVGLFPASNKFAANLSLDSICWWEQQPGLNFVRHSIERNRSLHSTCAVADVDGDGRTDLIVGEWAEAKTPASLRIFWNSPAKN